MVDFDKTYLIKFNTSTAVIAVEKLQKALEKINAEKATQNLKKFEVILDRIVSKMKESEISFLETGEAISDFGKKARDSASEAKKASADLQKSLGKEARKPVEKLAESAKKTSVQIQEIGLSAKEVGEKISSVGKKMTTRFTLPVVGAGLASIKMAMDFNKSMANVSTLTSGGAEQIKKFKSGVQDMSIETGKSTEDLADGLYNVISALGESGENIQQLGIASKASVAGVSSTTEAIDLLSAVTKAYGDTTAQALQSTSDFAFTAVKGGKTTFSELAASMGKVAPIAASINSSVGSQQELFALFSTLTGVTGSTAEVSTQIAAMYSSMLKPSESLAAATKKLGFSSASAMVKEIGLRDSLIALNKAAGGSQEKLAKMLGTKEALIPTLALVGSQTDNYVKKLEEVRNSAGETDRAYKKQTEGINKQGHSWEQTKRRFITFAQRVGDKLLPVMEKLFKFLEPFLKKLENLDDATLEWGIKFIGLHAAIGPVLSVVGGLTQKASGLFDALKSVSSVSSEGASAIGTMSKSMGGATTKASGFAKALGAVGAAAAALAVGYDIGTMLSKGIFEPHAESEAKKQDELANARRAAEDIARKPEMSTVKEKIAARARIEKAQADAPGTLFTTEGLLGTIGSIFGGEAPAQKMIAEATRAGQARKKLDESIKADMENPYETIQREKRIEASRLAHSQIKSGQSAGKTVNQQINVGATNVTVNAAGSPKEAERAVKKALRKQADMIKNAARNVSAGEQ